MLSLKQIAIALNGEIRGDEVYAPGPGHSAKDRTLSVKIKPSGDDVLVHCFSPAGNDLDYLKYTREKCGIKFKPNGRKPEIDLANVIRDAIASQSRRKPTYIFDYKDRDSTILYQLRKYKSGEPLSAHQPDGKGGWIDNLKGFSRRVLYRWPELTQFSDATVFFTEGEKDADRVASLGLCATTIAFGSWTDECVSALAGRNVWILEDNDEAGRERALKAAHKLHPVATSIKIIRLPGLGPKGDVSDWLDAGSTRDGLYEVCDATPDWEPIETNKDTSGAPEDTKQTKPLILSSKQFVAGYTPPDYLVDGLLLEAFLYCLTGSTGAGKTAITLRLAASIALGIPFAGRETKKRRVLYLAAENPADIRMRWIALAQQMDFDPDIIEVYFIEGVFRISKMTATLKAEAEHIGGEFGLIIVDTGPVFYEGDDENNRNQQGKHAELLRGLINFIPGKPSILANVHPVKNATPDNLLPAGGGNFLNQVDGNLTAAKTDSTTEMHWQGKFRGVEFAPLHFILRTITHERLKDSKERLVPTVMCDWISDATKEEIVKQRTSDEDRMLALIDADPRASQATLATKMGWLLFSGEPHKTKVGRCLKTLKQAKLIKETRGGNYKLTDQGKAALKGEDK